MKKFKFIVPMIAMVIALVAAFAQNSEANNVLVSKYYDAPSPCILCDSDGADACSTSNSGTRCECTVGASSTITAYVNSSCGDYWKIID